MMRKNIESQAADMEYAGPQLSIRLLRCISHRSQGEAELFVQTENHGTRDAWNIRVQVTMTPFSDYILEDWRSPDRLVGRLCPGDKQSLEFHIFPKDLRDQDIVVSFSASYREEAGDKMQDFYVQVPLTNERKEQTQIENPYVSGSPLDPRAPQNMFFGRRATIDFVLETLAGKSQNNILVLHGQRRAGKTSILLQLRYKHLKPPLFPVFLDMQGLTDTGTNIFLYRVNKTIADSLKEFGIEIEAAPRQAMLEAGYAAFEEFLNSVGLKLQGGHLVLMFDEFEELEKRVRHQKLDQDLLTFLRSQMQHRRWMNFIFAGTHQLEELAKEYFGIFFNTAIYREIGFLSRSETEALVCQPVSPAITFEDRAVKRIWNATYGHPYFIQLICYYLIHLANQEKRSQISFMDVDAVIQSIAESEQGHLDYLWAQSSAQERMVLAGIAELQRTLPRVKHFPKVEIRREAENVGGKISSHDFNRAIEGLVARDMILPDRENRAYGITIELFSRWIREKRPHASK